MTRILYIFKQITSTVTVVDNKWHHILVMYNVFVNIVYLYIDGVVNRSSSTFLNTVYILNINNNIGLSGPNDILDLNYLLLPYSFDTYISGTSVNNDGGILGSNCNGTLHSVGVGSATIVSSDSAKGTLCLQCITSDVYDNGGYMTIPAITLGGKS